MLSGRVAGEYDDDTGWVERVVATSLTLSLYLICRYKTLPKKLAGLVQEQDSYDICCETIRFKCVSTDIRNLPPVSKFGLVI